MKLGFKRKVARSFFSHIYDLRNLWISMRNLDGDGRSFDDKFERLIVEKRKGQIDVIVKNVILIFLSIV